MIDKLTKWMNEWINGWINEWMNGWMKVLINEFNWDYNYIVICLSYSWMKLIK